MRDRIIVSSERTEHDGPAAKDVRDAADVPRLLEPGTRTLEAVERSFVLPARPVDLREIGERPGAAAFVTRGLIKT